MIGGNMTKAGQWIGSNNEGGVVHQLKIKATSSRSRRERRIGSRSPRERRSLITWLR